MSSEFHSTIERLDPIDLPDFQGVRIMMMPLDFADVAGCWPDALEAWRPAVERLVDLSDHDTGVGYITIDEAIVEPDETHRRPGLHVDGVGPNGKAGSWGGGTWGGAGMLMASSVTGCRAWHQIFSGAPGDNGRCDHLRDQCRDAAEVVLEPGVVYGCNPLCVHEAIPPADDEPVRRQFVRLSNPNDAPWYEGYTRNPTGVEPAGPVHPPRSEEMAYREGV